MLSSDQEVTLVQTKNYSVLTFTVEGTLTKSTKALVCDTEFMKPCPNGLSCSIVVDSHWREYSHAHDQLYSDNSRNGLGSTKTEKIEDSQTSYVSRLISFFTWGLTADAPENVVSQTTIKENHVSNSAVNPMANSNISNYRNTEEISANKNAVVSPSGNVNHLNLPGIPNSSKQGIATSSHSSVLPVQRSNRDVTASSTPSLSPSVATAQPRNSTTISLYPNNRTSASSSKSSQRNSTPSVQSHNQLSVSSPASNSFAKSPHTKNLKDKNRPLVSASALPTVNNSKDRSAGPETRKSLPLEKKSNRIGEMQLTLHNKSNMNRVQVTIKFSDDGKATGFYQNDKRIVIYHEDVFGKYDNEPIKLKLRSGDIVEGEVCRGKNREKLRNPLIKRKADLNFNSIVEYLDWLKYCDKNENTQYLAPKIKRTKMMWEQITESWVHNNIQSCLPVMESILTIMSALADSHMIRSFGSDIRPLFLRFSGRCPLEKLITFAIQQYPTKSKVIFPDLILSICKVEPRAAFNLRTPVCTIMEWKWNDTKGDIEWIKLIWKCAAASTMYLPFTDMEDELNVKKPWFLNSILPNIPQTMTLDSVDTLPENTWRKAWDSPAVYFETHTTLLRYDCYNSLRLTLLALKSRNNSFIGELSKEDREEGQRNLEYHFFSNAKLDGLELSERSEGVLMKLSFSSSKKKSNSQLMFGNLLLIEPEESCSFSNPIYATVYSCEYKGNRTFAIVKLITKSLTGQLESDWFEQYQRLSRMTCGTAIECPTFFNAYRHVLEALHNIGKDLYGDQDDTNLHKPNTLPFLDILLDPKMIQPSIPKYISANSLISTGGKSEKLFPMKLEAWRDKLDTSQLWAVQKALLNNISVIQGPPGTGKTYIAKTIVEILLSIDTLPKRPIVIVTYKNHALDQFLNHCLEFCRSHDIVRIGSRCEMDSIKPCLLSEQRRRSNNESFYELRQLKDQKRNLKCDIQNESRNVTKKTVDVEVVLEVATEEEIRTIIKKYEKKELKDKKWFHNNPDLIDVLQNSDLNDSETILARKLLGDALQYWLKDVDFAVTSSVYSSPSLSPLPSSAAALIQSPTLEKEQDYDDVDIDMESGILNESDRRSGLDDTDDTSEHTMNIAVGKPQTKISISVHYKDFNILNSQQKSEICNNWITLFCMKSKERLEILLQQYEKTSKDCHNISLQNDINIVKKKRIVGCTTTGYAMHAELMEHLKPAVLIVEEAGEILEAQLLACFTRSLQHLIMIGDHQQLRGNVNCYELKKEKHLDISMFERLFFHFSSKNKSTLLYQARMPRSLAALYLEKEYENLSSNEQNLPIIYKQTAPPMKLEGKEYNSWWWRSMGAESSRGVSKVNEEEAEKVIALACFLVKQGVACANITILASYAGQVLHLRNLKRAKRGLIENTPIHTIDEYQGDQNDIIIVSTVRSNSENKIGYLSESNRLTVAASRCRQAMIFVGNDVLLERNKHWKILISSLAGMSRVQPFIELCCTAHTTNICHAVSANHLESFKCSHNCNQKMECNHICDKQCHQGRNHPKCTKRLSKRCEKNSVHTIEYPCYSAPRCTQICNLFMVCGHTCQEVCHVDIEHPACKFTMETQCTINSSHHIIYTCGSVPKCGYPCGRQISCGHFCELVCNHKEDCNLQCPTCIKITYQKISKEIGILRKKLAESQKTKTILVREILKETDPFFDMIKELATWSATHDNFQIISVERITNHKLEVSFREGQRDMKKPETPHLQLYHGTSVEGVEGIIREGFRQPKIGTTDKKTGKPPMYGYGLYFAKNITKSAQSVYTQGSGMVLVCDVLIGHSKQEKTAQNHYTLDIVRKMGYDSVWAPGGTDVINDEYIIYDARQAIPRYVVHFCKTAVPGRIKALKVGLPKEKVTISKSDIFNSNMQNSSYPEWKYNLYMQACGLFNTLHSSKEVAQIQVLHNPLLKARFKEKSAQFKKQNLNEIAFVFHGTREENLAKIAEEGFKNPRNGEINAAHGQAYGAGIYFADNPFVSEGYTGGGDKMLLCKILPGKVNNGTGNPAGYNSNHSNGIRVIYDSDQILPKYIIQYK